jgi:hypothetical protein
MSAQILQEAINRPTQIIQGKPTSKPNYWVFIKKDSPNKISVLEVSEAKEGIEIVGWRMENDKAVARIEKNVRKEGGQVLIEGDFSPAAADLSDFQPDAASVTCGRLYAGGYPGDFNHAHWLQFTICHTG